MHSVSRAPTIIRVGNLVLVFRLCTFALVASLIFHSVSLAQGIIPPPASGDHLSCFTFRDLTATRQKYTMRMPLSQYDPIGLSQECELRSPPKWACRPT